MQCPAAVSRLNCRLADYCSRRKWLLLLPRLSESHLPYRRAQTLCSLAAYQGCQHAQRTARQEGGRRLHNRPGTSARELSSEEVEAPATSAVGRIELILGPMFAGKSTELLGRVNKLEADGRRVAVIKSDKDDRYMRDFVVTHNGVKKECYAVATLAHLRAVLGNTYNDFEVFAIDEAQFFPDLLEFCLTAADHHSKTVLIAGLDGDFRRQRFGQVLDMVPVADNVTKLASSCAYCQQRALFSLRIAADDRQEVVGGADKYAPVCRQHYVSLSQIRAPPDDVFAAAASPDPA